MGPLRVCLLGGFEVRAGRAAVPIRFPTRKSEALFAYLAAHRGETLRREWLVELLWGGVPSTQGRHSLRQTLRVIKIAIGPGYAGALTVDANVVSLSARHTRVDLLTFKRLVRRGRRQDIRIACRLYGRGLLAGVSVQEPGFDSWAAQERGSVRHLAIEAHLAAIAALQAAGSLNAAIEGALRVVEIDPGSDRASRTLMHLYAMTGQYEAAFAYFERLTQYLASELGIPPSEEIREMVHAMYQEILAPQRRGQGTIRLPFT